MNLPLQLQSFSFHQLHISIYVPQLQQVQNNYRAQKQANPDTPFPYWAKVWPAAIAMAEYVANNKQLVQNKKVLELAAGLGLPSIVAAQFADKVIISDYLPDAVETIKQSIAYNKLENAAAELLNWYHLPIELSTDVLLLSDINYEPEAFTALQQVIDHFLQKGTTIILSTPQRLMAKPFIDVLLPNCIAQQQAEITLDNTITAVSIFVLQLH